MWDLSFSTVNNLLSGARFRTYFVLVVNVLLKDCLRNNGMISITISIFILLECDCNATGAIPGSLCTNDTAGQCQCKPGVTGRSCDQCMKFFTNFSDVGCEGNL